MAVITSKQVINWKRLWFPVSARVSQQTGYLSKSSRKHQSRTISEGVPLSQLRDRRCLVLLGTPGLGKTTEMKREADAVAALGAQVTFISFRTLTTAEELSSKILGEKKEAGPWHIFLDGLDEALADLKRLETEIPNIFAQLAAQIDFVNIYLRISCRSAEWSNVLELELQRLWPGEIVFDLGPLQQQDVQLAANQIVSSSRAKKFLEEIDRINARPLASRPVTLKMLLRLFDEAGELPTSQVEVYRRAILASIEDSNAQRVSGPQHWHLDGVSKLMVAARLAAAMIFSSSALVWTGSQSAQPSNALSLTEIATGFEPSLGSLFAVELADLQSVVTSFLFTPLELDLFAWSHQTFAEYLAAYYLNEHRLSSDQVFDFLCGETKKVPPQLYEVAAWLWKTRGA